MWGENKLCSVGGKHEGNVYRVLVINITERDRLENHGVDGRIILNLI
jgi:hypothetical protein